MDKDRRAEGKPSRLPIWKGVHEISDFFRKFSEDLRDLFGSFCGFPWEVAFLCF